MSQMNTPDDSSATPVRLADQVIRVGAIYSMAPNCAVYQVKGI